jgi:hypothetical protein
VSKLRTLGALCLLVGVIGCTSQVAGTAHVGAAGGGCSGSTIVEPKGAPYCYAVPSGFHSAQAELGGAKYTTGAALDKDNLIIAGVFPAPADLDKLSDSALKKAVDQLIGQQNSPSFKLASDSGALSKPPAGRAIEYHAVTNGSPPIHVDLYIIARGHTKVQLNCQSTNQQSKVETACGQVLQSLRITSAGK